MTELGSCRRQLGLSQAELADRLGIPLNSLRMWDSGLCPTPGDVLAQVRIAGAEAIRTNSLLPVLTAILLVPAFKLLSQLTSH